MKKRKNKGICFYNKTENLITSISHFVVSSHGIHYMHTLNPIRGANTVALNINAYLHISTLFIDMLLLL